MARFEEITYILPVYWASAIINGDDSGLSEEDIQQLNDWSEKEGHPNIVSVGEESYFSHSNDATNLGGDVAEYTAPVEIED